MARTEALAQGESRQTTDTPAPALRAQRFYSTRREKVKKIPKLETERLILRPLGKADAAEVMRLAGDREVADTTLNIPHPYKDGMAEEWIAKHQENFDKDQGATWAITRKSDGVLVGVISLTGMVEGHQAELGYWIGKPFWNHGYCSEAAQTVLWYAFSDLALTRVHASHFTRNPASGRVMRKIGMQHEGCRRNHVKKWDKMENLELYGILKSEMATTANQAMHRGNKMVCDHSRV